MTAGLSPGRGALLLAQSLVWDNHVCLPHRIDPSAFAELARHRAAGVHFASLNIGDAQVPLDTQIRIAAFFRAMIAANAEIYCLITRPEDVARAKAEGRLAIAFDVEGAWAIGKQLDLIPVYAQLGVRWLSLAFNRANAMGGGVHDDEDPGLSPLGGQLLDALDASGIVACCTHTGYRTARMAIAHQAERGRTLVLSHSNARALDDHPRNIPDSLIDAVATVDGVIGINGLSIFLGNADNLTERMVDHIVHVADRIGAAHVGLGLDYVYDQADLDRQLHAARGTWPSGFGYEPGIRFAGPETLPRLVDGLLARRWSDDDIAGFLGGNFLRVAKRVWR